MPIWEGWIRKETKAKKVKVYNGGIIGVFDTKEDAESEVEKSGVWKLRSNCNKGAQVVDEYKCWIKRKTRAICIQLDNHEIIGIFKDPEAAKNEKEKDSPEVKRICENKFHLAVLKSKTAAHDLEFYQRGIIGIFHDESESKAEAEKTDVWKNNDTGDPECWIRGKSKAFNAFIYKQAGKDRPGIIGQYYGKSDAEEVKPESFWEKKVQLEQNKSYTYVKRGKSKPKFQLENVFIVSRYAEDEIPSYQNKTIPVRELSGYSCIEIFAVIQAKIEEIKTSSYFLGYSEMQDLPSEAVIFTGNHDTTVTLEKFDRTKWGELQITWQWIFPYMFHNDPELKSKAQREHKSHNEGEYTNVNAEFNENVAKAEERREGGNFYFDTIEYNKYDAGEGWSPSTIFSPGTVRYLVNVKYGQKEVSSPGEIDLTVKKFGNLKNKEKDYKHGIRKRVHRISIRSSNPNPYISYIETFYKVPWIFGAAQVHEKGEKLSDSHQSDLFIGYDCAKLMIAAARHTGTKITQINDYRNENADTLARLLSEPRSKIRNYLKHVEISGIKETEYLQMNQQGETFKVIDKTVCSDGENAGGLEKIEVPFGTGRKSAQPGDLILFNWDEDPHPPNASFNHTTVLYANKTHRLNSETKVIDAHHSGVNIGRFPAHGCDWFVIRRWIPKSSRPIYVLLTGFEPFADVKINPSKTIAEKLHGMTLKIADRDVCIGSIIYPVAWFEPATRMILEIERGSPDIVISLGVKPEPRSPSREDSMIEIMSKSLNKNNTSTSANNKTAEGALQELLSDPKKVQIKDRVKTTEGSRIKDGGPEELPTDSSADHLLPVKKIEKAINSVYSSFAYIDTNPEDDDYICNQFFYNLLYHAEDCAGKNKFRDKVMVGFIHVPELKKLRGDDPLRWETKMVKSIQIAIEVSVLEFIKKGMDK